PEMLRFSGQRFQIHKRADKTCDTVFKTGGRRLHQTVHLQGVRCDGSGHGGCEAGCLMFWREAWLKRADGGRGAAPQSGPSTPGPAGGVMEPVCRCPPIARSDQNIFLSQITHDTASTE